MEGRGVTPIISPFPLNALLHGPFSIYLCYYCMCFCVHPQQIIKPTHKDKDYIPLTSSPVANIED